MTDCLREHGRDVWRVEWNITGTVLASSGDDNCVRMWKQKFDVGAGCGRLGYYIIKHLLASKYMWPDPAVAPFLLEC